MSNQQVVNLAHCDCFLLPYAHCIAGSHSEWGLLNANQLAVNSPRVRERNMEGREI